jgi:heat shock protein HtpX
MRTRFRPDRQLTGRMVLTVFLLGLLYVAFVAVLVALLRSVVVVVLIAGGLLAAQYWFSDRIALVAMRAREVTPAQEPVLHGVVDRLCATADMPKPRIAVADTDLPNAFATGRSSRRAVLCVTTGLLRRLDPAELDGVLAHELSHIAHRDVAVMTVASFLGVLAGLVTRFTFYSGLFGGRGRRGRDAGQAALVVMLVMAVSAVVYALSFLLVRALSRYRELAADRSGAMLTGHPSALAAALVKVSGDIQRIPTRDLRTVQAFNAFLFAPALGAGPSIGALLSTHPTLERRLDQLAELSTELGEAAPGGRVDPWGS